MIKKIAVSFFFLISLVTLFSCQQETIQEYKVSFNSTYDTEHVPGDLILKAGETLLAEQVPELTWEGFVFTGWYDNDLKVIPGIYTVNKDVELKAKWTTNSGIKYTVQYWIENLDNSAEAPEYLLNDKVTQKGPYNVLTSARAKDYPGFTVKDFDQQLIVADGSTIVDIYYTRNTNTPYTVEHYLQNDDLTTYTLQEKDTQTLYGTTGTQTKSDTKDYPHFTALSHKEKTIAGNGSTTVKIYYDLIQSAKYTVKHYLQNIENDEYSEDVSNQQTLTGASGKSSKAIVIKYEGFSAKPFDQKIIDSDDSTVISIYYDRLVYTIKFDTNGGSEMPPVQGKYGKEVPEIIAPLKTGYIFAKWTPSKPSEFSKDVTLKASWRENSLSYYKVEHYFENADNDEFELKEYEYITDDAGKLTEAEPKTVAGFTAQTFNQETIKDDKSTVIKIYYKRNIITYSFNTAGGSTIGNITGKYGTSVPVVSVPLKENFAFSQWNKTIPPVFKESLEFTALWTPDRTGIEVNKNIATQTTIEFSITETEDKITFTVPALFESYKWFLDGESIPGYLNFKTIVKNELEEKTHHIMVLVRDEYEYYYSANVTFSISY